MPVITALITVIISLIIVQISPRATQEQGVNLDHQGWTAAMAHGGDQENLAELDWMDSMDPK